MCGLRTKQQILVNVTRNNMEHVTLEVLCDIRDQLAKLNEQGIVCMTEPIEQGET